MLPMSRTPPTIARTRKALWSVKFRTSSDGVRLAYARVCEGLPLVKAGNWLNHLEHDWDSPV